MGLCGSTDGGRQNSVLIQEELVAMHEADATKLKLLLLGTGESGKSTVLKQMQIISGAGFTSKEVEHFRSIILANILESIQSLVRAAQQNHIAFARPESNVSRNTSTERRNSFPRE